MRTLVLCALLCSAAMAQEPVRRAFPAGFPNEEGRPVSVVNSGDRGLWFLSANGVFRYAGGAAELAVEVKEPRALFFDCDTMRVGNGVGELIAANSFTGQIHSRQSLADSVPVSCVVRFAGHLLAGTAGSGIVNVYTPQNAKKPELSDPFVYAMAAEGDRLYVATDRGVDVFDSTFNRIGTFPETGITSSLAVIGNSVYAGSYNRGLWKIDRGKGATQMEGVPQKTEIAQLLNLGGKLVVRSRKSIAVIADGDVRVVREKAGVAGMAASGTRGIIVIYRDAEPEYIDLEFSIFVSDAEAPITCITSGNGNIYYSTESGIYGLDAETGKPLPPIELPGKPLVASMETSGKTLYIGTFNEGVYAISGDGRIRRYAQSDGGLPDNNVLSMSFADDTLWVATLSGLSLITAGVVKPLTEAPGLGSTYIYDVRSHMGKTFVATDGDGVFRYNKGRFFRVESDGKLEGTTAYSFASSGEALWCITREQGVFRFSESDGSFKPFGNHQPSGFSSFGVSKGGDVFYLNAEGLTRMSAAERVVYPRETFSESWSGTYLQTFSADGRGRMYFASGATLFGFEPMGALSFPQVFLQSWEVNYSSANPSVGVLDSDEVNHSFTLGSTWYSDIRNQSYAYRLAGIDAEFKTAQSGEITYPNLPYGEYELLAKAGYNGVYYEPPTSLLTFTIAKPIYLRTWFIVLAILVIPLLIMAIVRIRVGQVNRVRLAEKRLVESELAVLRNQVNPHFLFNSFNTLLNMIETHPERAGNYLQKLSDFYRGMLDKRSDQVVRLGEELEVLREYIYLQEQRFGKALDVDIRLSDAVQNSKIPALTLQLLLENAIKHNVVSASSPLAVEIYEEDGFLIVRNRLAPKHKAEPGTGTGLENILSRYRALFNAEARVETTSGFFTVYLPLISP